MNKFARSFLKSLLHFKRLISMLYAQRGISKFRTRCKESKLSCFTQTDWTKSVYSVLLIDAKHCQKTVKTSQPPLTENSILPLLCSKATSHCLIWPKVQQKSCGRNESQLLILVAMAIGVVEFSREGYKIRKVFA